MDSSKDSLSDITLATLLWDKEIDAKYCRTDNLEDFDAIWVKNRVFERI